MDADGTLNIFEQRPIWSRLAINLAFCFHLLEPIDIAVTIAKLHDGLETLTKSFPWIAGQVITEGRGADDKRGVAKIIPGDDALAVMTKDHRKTPSIHSMQELRERGYSVGMLDESVFAPRPAAVAVPFAARPVLLVRANIIPGGLVLVLSGDHAAINMPGLIQISRWFSKACHNTPFPLSELEIGNMSRRDLIPLLDSTYQQGGELAQQVPPTVAPNTPYSRAPCKWSTFKIPACAIDKIKTSATATCTSPYVSTDDSLSAFVWQSIARARMQRLAPTTISTAARCVDVRKVLDIPLYYPGLVQNNLFHKHTLRELSELPLGIVASTFRDAITSRSPSLSFYSRAVATALTRSTNKGSLRVGANLDLSSDLLISSFLTSGAYQLDFALDLGLPEAVRLTRQDAFESMAYLLPFTPDGDAAILACIRDVDLVALMADEEFSRFAKHMG